jgi:alpha-D-ribose 1-methylphosphonate 5-triphosphate diphosphatase
MDHTPGQGQFKTLESYITYKIGTYRVTPDEVTRLAEWKVAQREKGFDHMTRLVETVRKSGLPFLSHDDDTSEKVALVQSLGVSGCEFPVSMEAVKAAKHSNMKVFMGAPNFMRDRSSNGHLKASDALLQGLCDALVSDYYPECLLQAPFLAAGRYSLKLEEALKLVTSTPGDYLDRHQTPGRLAPGGPADLLVIDTSCPWASVVQTWVSGTLRCSHG